MPLIPSPTGVLGDPRLDPKVQNGWKADDVLIAAGAAAWKHKTPEQLRRFEVMNQAGTSACVAFAKAKQLAIEIFLLTGVWITLSPASIYQLRFNRPGLGMAISDANDIANKRGATLEALMKSQNLTEEQIHLVKRTKVADLFAAAVAEAVVQYLYLPVDIDRIAERIEEGHGVSLLVFAEVDEYDAVPSVKHPSLQYEDAYIRHEVVAVDYFLLPDGQKALRVEDSAHFAGVAVRDFTESFLEQRVILADFLAVFDFEGGVGDKPRYDGTIISLQKCLRYEGLFPTNVAFAENYGPVTKDAVIKFQKKYGIEPAVGNFGPITRAKIISLYP